MCKLYFSAVTYVMLRQFAKARVAFLLIGVCLRKLLVNGDFIGNTKAEFRGIKSKEIKKIVIENILTHSKYENYVKVKRLQNFQNLCICTKTMWLKFHNISSRTKIRTITQIIYIFLKRNLSCLYPMCFQNNLKNEIKLQ